MLGLARHLERELGQRALVTRLAQQALTGLGDRLVRVALARALRGDGRRGSAESGLRLPIRQGFRGFRGAPALPFRLGARARGPRGSRARARAGRSRSAATSPSRVSMRASSSATRASATRRSRRTWSQVRIPAESSATATPTAAPTIAAPITHSRLTPPSSPRARRVTARVGRSRGSGKQLPDPLHVDRARPTRAGRRSARRRRPARRSASSPGSGRSDTRRPHACSGSSRIGKPEPEAVAERAHLGVACVHGDREQLEAARPSAS